MNFFSKKAAYATASLVQRVTPTCHVGTKYGDIKFYCPSHVTVWRAETFLTKEPETLEWIDTFGDGIFWDIGANIGCYTIYAGKRGIETCAFEPVASNYHVLNVNIVLNGLAGRVDAYPIAFGSVDRVGRMKLSEMTPGSAMHQFGQGLTQGQGSIGMTIDRYIDLFRVEVPAYIKIDVDGNEKDILVGASETLKDERVESVLVELHEEDPFYKSIIKGMEERGFDLVKKAHSDMFEGTAYSTIYNHIFWRGTTV